jgi:Na+/melibiose symporter-like transporter
MPLSVRLKRNLTSILVVFALLAISVILYFFFAVKSQISSTQSTVNTLQTSLNVILSAIITALTLLYNLIFTWTLWTLAFFIISVIAVYYFLNQYFIEKKNALIDELT